MKIKIFKFDDSTLLVSFPDGEIIVRGNYGEGVGIETIDKKDLANTEEEFTEKEVEI